MNAQIIWTFEFEDNSRVSFVAPEPCDKFTVGIDGDIPIRNCPGEISVSIGDTSIEAKCVPQICLNGAAGYKGEIVANKQYVISDLSDKKLFSFKLELRQQIPAPVYDRSIELTLDRIKVGGTEDCHIQLSQSYEASAAFELKEINLHGTRTRHGATAILLWPFFGLHPRDFYGML